MRLQDRIDEGCEIAGPRHRSGFAEIAPHQSVRIGHGVKPAGQGVSATTETSGKPGDLDAEEKDAADILGGNATGDKKRVDAAIAHHAKTDKRAG